LGTVIIAFIVPETTGKTREEIQLELRRTWKVFNWPNKENHRVNIITYIVSLRFKFCSCVWNVNLKCFYSFCYFFLLWIFTKLKLQIKIISFAKLLVVCLWYI
jgi:hypothetical protein